MKILLTGEQLLEIKEKVRQESNESFKFRFYYDMFHKYETNTFTDCLKIQLINEKTDSRDIVRNIIFGTTDLLGENIDTSEEFTVTYRELNRILETDIYAYSDYLLTHDRTKLERLTIKKV